MKSQNLILVILLVATRGMAQDIAGWERFQPRTMKTIVEQASESRISSLGGTTVVFTNQFLPSQVTLTYTGESRSISGETKEFIKEWVNSVALHPKIPKLFQRELMFAEGSSQYWLPVPNNGPNYERVLKEGESVTLFITPIGMKKHAGEIQWFFVVNKFERK